MSNLTRYIQAVDMSKTYNCSNCLDKGKIEVRVHNRYLPMICPNCSPNYLQPKIQVEDY